MGFSIELSISKEPAKNKEQGKNIIQFERQHFSDEDIRKNGQSIFQKYLISGNIWDGTCAASNYIGATAVVLDYDEGLSLEKAKDLFSNWHYIIYTSTSHRVDIAGKGGVQDRFRVILPLEPTGGNHWQTERLHNMAYQEILAMFPRADKACKDAARKFYPSFADNGLFQLFVSDNTNAQYFEIIPSTIDGTDKNKLDGNNIPTFSLDDRVLTREGNEIRIGDISEKTPIYCPFCDRAERANPEVANAAVNIEEGIHMLYCSSCDSRGRGYDGVYNLDKNERFQAIAQKEGIYLILDKGSDSLYLFSKNNALGIWEWRPISKGNLKILLEDYDAPIPDRIPVCNLAHKFDQEDILDVNNRVANLYIMPDHLKDPGVDPPDQVPDYIARVMHHVVGNDDEMYEHLLNHVSTMISEKKKLITAWLFSGIQGTGKNVFVEQILGNVIGSQYVMSIGQKSFVKEFNKYIEDNFILLVDEVEADFQDTGDKVGQKLREIITGQEHIGIEAKGKDARIGKANANIFMASNKRTPLILQESDRRVNVCEYQPQPIYEQDWWKDIGAEQVMQKIREEIPYFIAYLYEYPYDYQKTVTSKRNKARERFIERSKTYTEQFIEAVEDGDLEWIWDHIAEPDYPNQKDVWRKCKRIVYDQLTKKHGKISRDDLHALYKNITNTYGWGKSKFTRLLHNHSMKLEVKQVRIGDETTRGLDNIVWNTLPTGVKKRAESNNEVNSFSCGDCGKVFTKKWANTMHCPECGEAMQLLDVVGA